MNHPPLTTSTGRRATGAVGFATRTTLLLASVFILGLMVLEKQSRQITARRKRFRERVAIKYEEARQMWLRDDAFSRVKATTRIRARGGVLHIMRNVRE